MSLIKKCWIRASWTVMVRFHLQQHLGHLQIAPESHIWQSAVAITYEGHFSLMMDVVPNALLAWRRPPLAQYRRRSYLYLCTAEPLTPSINVQDQVVCCGFCDVEEAAGNGRRRWSWSWSRGGWFWQQGSLESSRVCCWLPPSLHWPSPPPFCFLSYLHSWKVHDRLPRAPRAPPLYPPSLPPSSPRPLPLPASHYTFSSNQST